MLFVWCKCQDFVDTVPLSRVAVHHLKLARTRLEPHARDAAAIITAVFIVRGEVYNAAPTAYGLSGGFNTEANLVVQRKIDLFF